MSLHAQNPDTEKTTLPVETNDLFNTSSHEDLSVSALPAIISSLRPHQWVKNSLVFASVIFSGQFTDPVSLWAAWAAFLIFCLSSSAVYLLNDIADLKADRHHPVKRCRPVTSGRVSLAKAAMLCAFLIATGITAGFLVGFSFGCIMCIYFIQNIAYSLLLRQIAILDIMIVATGYLLRAIAGAVAVSVKVSPWLVICSLMLALFVACGKRRHDLQLLINNSNRQRQNRPEYTPELLDLMMAMTGCAGVMTYVLYTLSPGVAGPHGTYALVLTVPTVLYGVFRFLYLVHCNNAGGDPSRLFVMDKGLLLNGVVWLLVTCFAMYAPHDLLPWWRLEL